MQKFALITLAIASLAVAHPARRTDGDTCNTGPTQCCNRVEQPSNLSGSTTALLSDLGVTLSGLLGDVGLNCNPITVIGTSNTCETETVCCSNNSFNGVVSLGCSPINISL